MMYDKTLNFSFSGLKTAVAREVKKLQDTGKFNEERIQNLAYEIEESITDVLVAKTLKAAEQYRVKSILIGGGVAANKRLTEKFNKEVNLRNLKITMHIPPPSLCTDNAAYIACCAHYFHKPVPWKDINARPDLEVEV